MLKLAGFHLTKFVSNVPDVTTAPDPDNRESNSSVKDICTSPDQSSHVLGPKWEHRRYAQYTEGIETEAKTEQLEQLIIEE